jgi:hypothetical protein
MLSRLVLGVKFLQHYCPVGICSLVLVCDVACVEINFTSIFALALQVQENNLQVPIQFYKQNKNGEVSLCQSTKVLIYV